MVEQTNISIKQTRSSIEAFQESKETWQWQQSAYVDYYSSQSINSGDRMSLIFVDCEADMRAPCPNMPDGGMTEFAAVEFESRKWFHAKPSVI